MSWDRNIGRVLDRRYELVERLAEGGMGLVYRARHVQTEAALAVKFLRPELCANLAFVRRLQREAKYLALARHDNIVELIDMQPEAAEPYLVTELLVGEDLSALLQREGRLPWRRVQALLLQVCDGMQRAHECGLVHRDLKLANCFELAHNGRLKILDFGVSRPVDRAGDKAHSTAFGQICGTPGYMPVEQCIGDDIDARADVYAVGAMMFELLTGRLPFGRASPFEFVTRLNGMEPPKMASVAERLDCPAAAELVVRRALAWRRDDRYEGMRELAAALRACSATTPQEVLPEPASASQSSLLPSPQHQPEPAAVSLSLPVIRMADPNASTVSQPRPGRRRRALGAAVLLSGATAVAWATLPSEAKPRHEDSAAAPPTTVQRMPEVDEGRCDMDEPPTTTIVQCESVTRADAPAPEMEPEGAPLALASVAPLDSPVPASGPSSTSVRKARQRQLEQAMSQLVQRLELRRYVSHVEITLEVSSEGAVQALRVRNLEGTRHQAQVEAALRELTVKPFPGGTLKISRPYNFD
ncbi:protein kinase [Nannocystis sp. ILAH1]|uniref:serine/threonine-protein kinase n=1 Tax=Nannocystis sp. ILAH1 TaxID=2996789 RepID=UPI00226D96CC|nr:protein kinase [Nannocystis sp. ILAH1]